MLYKVEIITKQERQDVLKNALREIGVAGMTITNVLGCGNQKGKTEVFRGNTIVVDFLPKIRFEILCDEGLKDKIIETTLATINSGNVGDGKIIILPVEDVIRIRTGEKGKQAI